MREHPTASLGLIRAFLITTFVLLVDPHEAPGGYLDDVCVESVRDDPAMPCADSYI